MKIVLYYLECKNVLLVHKYLSVTSKVIALSALQVTLFADQINKKVNFANNWWIFKSSRKIT